MLQDLTESLFENLSQNVSQTSTDVPNLAKNIKLLGIDIDETLIARAIEKNKYKENISYMCLNIMEPSAMEFLTQYIAREKNKEETQRYNESVPSTKTTKFNIVFCFSVTMWIHLNHGDQGLLEFLEKIVSLGEYLVLENQLWKCYRNAQRRMVRNASKKSKVNVDEKEGRLENEAKSEESNSGGGNTTEFSSHIEQSVEEISDNKPNSGRRKTNKNKSNSEDFGFKYYKELKIRSNVDKEIDNYLTVKCKVRKLYESEPNEWGRVITVYECRT